MEDTITCQGREITISDLKWLRNWITKDSDWSINRLTVELCRIWNWYTHTGYPKTFSGRSFFVQASATRYYFFASNKSKVSATS